MKICIWYSLNQDPWGGSNSFLTTLGQACNKTGWRVHAYVLMGNHFHLLVETPESNLVSGMQWLQSTYTQCHNERQAEQLKAKALRLVALKEASLKTLPKGSVEKEVLAWYIHGRTMVSNEWLSEQLHCGHPGNIPRYVKAVETSKDKAVISLKEALLKCED